MNSNESQQSSTCSPDGEDPRDALIDAALREHARLGGRDDESLLVAVRSRTVDRPAPARVVELPIASSQSELPRPRRHAVTTREWLRVAAVVALSVTGTALFLSQRTAPSSGTIARTEQTFRLVSRPLTATAVASEENRDHPGMKTPSAAVPRLGEFAATGDPGFAAPGSVAFASPDFGGVDPVSAELLAEFSVSAERILRASPGRLVYEGEVVLKHPDFTLKADRLELATAPASSSATEDASRVVGGFVAEGEDLKIEKRAADGEIEVARAATATWDADGGRLILAGGPPTLDTGSGGFVRPRSPGGVIVLRADGYQVIER